MIRDSRHEWEAVEKAMWEALYRVFPAAVLLVRQNGQTLFHRAYGYLDPEVKKQPTQLDTRFDLASLTKIFTATAFLALVNAGRVGLDQPVAEVLPGFRGPRPIRPYADPLHPGREIAVVPTTDETVDAGRVTFRHLLTHTSGLPAWNPLHRLGSPRAIMEATLRSDFSYPTGTRVLYSDLGFILLGEAIARLTDQPLDAALRELVLEPLGLQATGFHRRSTASVLQNVAPTEYCAWREKRLRGEVHDENAATLGGVAGHAGLFGTAAEVAALGQLYLDGGRLGDVRLLRPETACEAVQEQARFLGERRGLGWMLRPEERASCGHFFSLRSYGHTGFTGTSLWVDPEVGLVVALLTNRVYHGRDPTGIAAFRPALHDAIYRSAVGDYNGPSGAERSQLASEHICTSFSHLILQSSVGCSICNFWR